MRVHLELDVPSNTYFLDDLLEDGEVVENAGDLVAHFQRHYRDVDRLSEELYLVEAARLRVTVVDDDGNATEATWGNIVHEVTHGVAAD
jgi:hypothetical protein